MLICDMYAMCIIVTTKCYYTNYSNNKIDSYYVQIYVTFQYLHYMPSGNSHCDSGPGVGQGHTSHQFMSMWCLLL